MPITDALPDLERELTFYPAVATTPRSLTQEQVQNFNQFGFVFPLDVFTPEEAEANRAYFDDIIQKALDLGYSGYNVQRWHTCCRGIYDIITDSRLLDYVEDVLGENLVIRGSHCFCKMPGDEKRVAWHQDASYWPITPSKIVTAWLAIDDVDEENGAMQIIPGSHLKGQIPFERSTPEEKNVLGQTVHGVERFGDAPISLNLKAGQISLHSDLLLHSSIPNLSDRRRCGIAIRFVPPEATELKGWSNNTVIARGVDPTGNWFDHPAPEGENIPLPRKAKKAK